MDGQRSTTVLVLGAGGLLGSFIAADLTRREFRVVAVARKFNDAQRYVLGESVHECRIGDFDPGELGELLEKTAADIIVNCLGMLQAAPGEGDIHDVFMARLIEAIRAAKRPILLLHVSIPGEEADDHTGFAITKRRADRRIMASGLPYVILRPGFVIAPAAYGGSALLRAFAALPFVDFPAYERDRPFASVAVEDIAETVAIVAARFGAGEQQHAAVWDLVHPGRLTVGDVVAELRRWFGTHGGPRFAPPRFLLDAGAYAGDFASWFGWRPPIRSTAIAEMRRGVTGDPGTWMAATGIVPRAFADILRARPSTVQERWFARLYLPKALILIVLVIFWCVSGGIVLAFSFEPAAAMLVAHGFTQTMANAATVFSSLMDISVGLAIAVRSTSRVGLIAGIGVSFFYMAGAAVLTPELWLEPLGALVKTGPAIVLMLVALGMADDR